MQMLSGRYAYTVGANAEVIVDGVPDQLPTNIRTVADLLSQQAGWATAAFGKWDAGMTSWGCTPTCRGFDHFSGFYNAYNDYFTHTVGPGLDLRQDFAADSAENGTYFTELLTTRVTSWIKGGSFSSDTGAVNIYSPPQCAHTVVHGIRLEGLLTHQSPTYPRYAHVKLNMA